jgi:hypothetical protein
MNLAETQRLFWDLLEGRERPLDAFVDSPALPASERVAIYARMFLDRQIDALRETFPKVVAALGDGPFYELAAQYVRAHPSRHPDLGQLGRELAAFLPRRDLGDLARLEWARAEVFEAPAGRPLTPDELASLAQDAAAFARHRVQLIPALRLLDLAHDVEPLWEGQSTTAEARATHVVVWRKEFEVFHVAVEADEAEAVRLALAGAALGDVCGALEHPERAAETLQSWLGEGWIGANR